MFFVQCHVDDIVTERLIQGTRCKTLVTILVSLLHRLMSFHVHQNRRCHHGSLPASRVSRAFFSFASMTFAIIAFAIVAVAFPFVSVFAFSILSLSIFSLSVFAFHALPLLFRFCADCEENWEVQVEPKGLHRWFSLPQAVDLSQILWSRCTPHDSGRQNYINSGRFLINLQRGHTSLT